jgi:hypothetical protein
MPSVSRIPSLGGDRIRLAIGGSWSAQADAEVSAGGFDVVEFHSGDYEDFTFLIPHRDVIESLSILGGRWKSTRGLESLHKLRALTVGPPLDKSFDFSALPRLETLNIDGWLPRYARTLFTCAHLTSLRIEGYGGKDCRELASLAQLRRLTLAKGALTSLQGLSACSMLESIALAHLRKLTDVSEIAQIPTLRELELSDALPGLREVNAILTKTGLRRLSLRALDIEWPDISWLAKFTTLDVLGIWNVRPFDWDALFASPTLKKLAVTFTTSTGLSLDQVREIARAHGLPVTDIKPIGVPARQKGYLLECRPAGSTQNLWYWNEAERNHPQSR